MPLCAWLDSLQRRHHVHVALETGARTPTAKNRSTPTADRKWYSASGGCVYSISGAGHLARGGIKRERSAILRGCTESPLHLEQIYQRVIGQISSRISAVRGPDEA